MSDTALTRGPTPAGGRPGSQGDRPVLRVRSWEGLLLLVVVSVQLGRYPILTHPLSTDIRHFSYFSALVAHGGLPHVDYFDNKTQLSAFAGGFFVEIAELTGADRLITLRVGYVGIALLAAVLLFVIQRRLWNGRFSGWLGLAPYLGLPLLGLLPAIGCIPKLIMATAASAAALAAVHRRWVLAGALGIVAALDWQVGGLVLLGALAAAVSEPRGLRLGALQRVVLGAGLGFLPFLLRFAAGGGLVAAWQQAVVASLFRGTASLEERGIVEDWPRRLDLLREATYGGDWLLAAGLLGFLVFAWRITTLDRAHRPLAVTLAVYHYGLMAFSGIDFQAYGDAFALFHSVAFFAGTTINAGHGLLAVRLRGSRAPVLEAAAACLFVLAVWRPWLSPSQLRLVPPRMAAPFALEDQRRLALQLAQRFEGRHVAVLGTSDLLFLGNFRSALPMVFWNSAAYGHYRRDATEASMDALLRIIHSSPVEFFVVDESSGFVDWGLRHFRFAGRESTPSGYGVVIYRTTDLDKPFVGKIGF